MGKKRGSGRITRAAELAALGVSASARRKRRGRAPVGVVGPIKKKKKDIRVEKRASFIERELSRIEDERRERQRANPDKSVRKRKSGLLKLSGLGEALNDIDVEKKERTARVLTEKERRRILAVEAKRVKEVWEHPAFVEDPMGSLRMHLLNTVTQDPASIPEAIAKKRKRRKAKEKEFRSGRQIRAAGKRKERMAQKAKDAELAAELAKKGPKRGAIGEKRPKT